MNELLIRQFDYKPKIAVFGDVLIDEYYFVDADKVSPEFPIPRLLSQDGIPHRINLGGAANVCSQFKNFNVETSLFGLVNNTISKLAEDINIENCISYDSIPVKKRFYSKCGFPLCRIDVENEILNISNIQNEILSKLNSQIFDVVVFSDYDKGLLRGEKEFIKQLSESTITIVDPKRSPINRWKNCSIIKPNYKEATEISGTEIPELQCDYFIKNTNCQAVIITHEANRVFGKVMGSWFEYHPKTIKRAKSVIGAGDCFIAFLSMCMAHSIDIKKAVEIAFNACSKYVDDENNAPIFPFQLESSKYIDPRNLAKRNFSLSFVNGCFDILHPGHIKMLEFAKSKADKLIVALNSDESVDKQNKKHHRINDLEYRKTMISALECVDFVVSFSEENPINIIKQTKPDVLVKGSDWSDPIEKDFVEQFYSFDLFGNYSTTSIINKIQTSISPS